MRATSSAHRRRGSPTARARAGPGPVGRTFPASECRGPDQGYALELATRFKDRLALEPGEHAEDVLSGAVAIALRRAAIFGRAPISADIELALRLFGCLVGDRGAAVPGELVAWRREHLAGAAHDYWARRALADAVPEATLRLSPCECDGAPRGRAGPLAGARRRLSRRSSGRVRLLWWSLRERVRTRVLGKRGRSYRRRPLSATRRRCRAGGARLRGPLGARDRARCALSARGSCRCTACCSWVSSSPSKAQASISAATLSSRPTSSGSSAP